MDNEFIEECIRCGVQIIWFTGHGTYKDDGNFDDSTRIGIKFIAVPFDCDAVLTEDDFYLQIEEFINDLSLVGDSPQEALQKYKQNNGIINEFKIA